MDEPEKSPTHPLPPRPEVLDGTTYKIKTPNSEHAFYV
ncbi:MAG: NrdJb, partial [Magnetococcales bacterium]|nr:NrdJb [Magnetococcales bacterium]